MAIDYRGEPVPDAMTAEVGALLADWRVVEDAEPAVREHCLELGGDNAMRDFGSRDSVDVTSCVTPTHLVGLDNEGVRGVGPLCDYRYDPEEGLALVFENERLSEITTQSDCL